MFDEAMNSRDPRVMDALRNLMMMVTLTRPESRNSDLHDRNPGPLRRMYEDLNHLHRRIERVEVEVRNNLQKESCKYPYEKYTLEAAQNIAQNKSNNELNQLIKSW
jgi:hypothetical protein